MEENPACHQTCNLNDWDGCYECSPADAGRKRPGIAEKQWDEGEESKCGSAQYDKYGGEISKFFQEADHFPYSTTSCRFLPSVFLAILFEWVKLLRLPLPIRMGCLLQAT